MLDNETAGYVVILREGSSQRTAEELCAVFVGDVRAIVSVEGRLDQIERANSLNADAVRALGADDFDSLDDLVHCAEMLLGEVSRGSMWVEWDDGYVIYTQRFDDGH